MTLDDSSAAAPCFTAPEVSADETLSFELVVSDGQEDSTPDSVSVLVQDVPDNRAPSADAGPDQTVVTPATVTLDGSGSSDPDGDTLSYSWIRTGGPSVTLQNGNSAQARRGRLEADQRRGSALE